MGRLLKNPIVEGQKFGNWITLENRQVGVRKILVRCKCGLEKLVQAHHLVSGASRGCRKCRIVPKGSDHFQWSGIGPISGSVFWQLQYTANKRNIPFTITLPYVAKLYDGQSKKCALTGRLLSFGNGNRWGSGKTASLDRIDSAKGYVDGNVQWVHKDINIAKHALPQQDFITLCKEVVDHFNQA